MTTWLAHPEALWLLALLPALASLALWSARRRRRALALLGGGLALHRLTSGRRGLRFLRGACLGLGLVALVAGIAGPQWGQEDTEAAHGRDLVVVLDLSRSMLAEQPSRQERAVKALRDLADAAERRGGHRLALVVFAAHARVACPLTHDYDHFRDALAQQDAAEPPPALRPHKGDPPTGTRIGEALRLAVSPRDARHERHEAQPQAGAAQEAQPAPPRRQPVQRQAAAQQGQQPEGFGVRDPNFPGGQDVLLVSDGDDPAGDGEWATGAAAASKHHIPVYAVGVGDPEKSYPIPVAGGYLKHDGKVVETRLREGPLQKIAGRTGGLYIPARTRPLPLGRWLREVIEPRKVPRPDEDDLLPVYRQHSAWFFGAALGLLALTLLIGDGSRGAWRGARRARRRLFGGRPQVAAAPGPAASAAPAALALALLAVAAGPPAQDLLRRGNSAYGAEKFDEAVEDYAGAEERATDPGLVAFNKAAALYRLGRYREAELHYRRCLDDAAGPRRARALYDLGNCLLQQGRDRDARLLEQAIACYRACRRAPAAGPSLAADAGHNLELARLLWLKARASGADEQQPKSDEQNNDMSPKGREDGGKSEAGGDATDPDDPQAAQQAREKQAAEDRQGADRKMPTAGRGTLQTLPDTDELVPLPPEDTAAYLDRLVERIRRERREHWRSAVPADPNVRDW
jgi:tetratricopeptide (TPR) repeat protein